MLIIVLMIAAFLSIDASYLVAPAIRFIVICQSLELQYDILKKLEGERALVDCFQRSWGSLVDVVVSAKLAQRISGYCRFVHHSQFELARKLQKLLRDSHNLIDYEINRNDIVKLVGKQIQRDEGSKVIPVNEFWNVGFSHTSEIHALHVACKDLWFVFGEIDWFCITRIPARGACRFHEPRSSSEQLSMHGKALLVRFFTSEDFESISEIEPASVSCARIVPRVAKGNGNHT
jgi:hypothetical protein